jgi:hypothetical protein
MASLFYDQLIDWKKLTAALDDCGIDGDERLAVLDHIEHILHTEVLVVIVSSLPAHKHEEFMELFHAAPYDEGHFQFLITHGTGDVRQTVKSRSDQIIEEIVNDLFADDEDDLAE